ncbi:isochorismate synthase [Limnochorda pilosa]|uniref:isochorismate synthase n=1 Tax=Limnochorda pilosa TaxID=1555112 RepID=A0A0K2SMN9_LIMPI|nr:isochorismate synthase [Limnochorda pilosa]
MGRLEAFLSRAIAEAGQRGEPLLASWVSAIPAQDPLVLLTRSATPGGVRLFWSELLHAEGLGGARLTLVGAGTVQTLRGEGAGAFHTTRKGWRRLSERAVTEGPAVPGTGPLFLGGFAFDPPDEEPWHGFPGGLLILPEALVTSRGDEGWLTLNAWVEPGDDPQEIARRLARKALHLLVAPRAVPPGASGAPHATTGALAVHEPAPEPWMRAVASAAEAVRRGRVRKVVLAQAVRVHRPGGFDPARVLAALAAANPRAIHFALDLGGATFLGASPELLARVRDGWVESMALAGSAPRGETPAEDDRLGRGLLESVKEREEHQAVVDALREGLSPLTEILEVSPEPRLLRLPTVQHLHTPLRGRLAPGTGLLDVVEKLHPTPAVGGSPREEALRLVRALEGWNRGWYAGPIGWVDPAGNGAFAVAIRSGLLREDGADLFAGCGIVGGSRPEAEVREWRLKLRPFLTALEEAAQ